MAHCGRIQVMICATMSTKSQETPYKSNHTPVFLFNWKQPDSSFKPWPRTPYRPGSMAGPQRAALSSYFTWRNRKEVEEDFFSDKTIGAPSIFWWGFIVYYPGVLSSVFIGLLSVKRVFFFFFSTFSRETFPIIFHARFFFLNWFPLTSHFPLWTYSSVCLRTCEQDRNCDKGQNNPQSLRPCVTRT